MNDVTEFDYKTAATITEIEETDLYISTKEVCGKLTEQQLLNLTSYLGLSISVALADGKLYQSEVEFIVKILPKSLNLSENQKDALIQVNMAHAQLKDGYSVTTPHFCQYLKGNTSPEAREKLVKLLFKLSLSDGDFAEDEKLMIGAICKRLGVKQEQIDRVKKNVVEEMKSKPPANRGTEVTFLKNVKQVEQKPEKKRYLRKVKSREVTEQVERIKKAPLYPYVERLSENVEPEDLLFITCYLSVGFSLIGTDDDIHEKEVAYFRTEFRQFYELRGKYVDSYINICVYLCEQKRFNEEYLDDYLHVLSKYFDKEEKKRFALVLFNLADSDDDVSPLELILIEKILEHFEIDEEQAETIKDSALGIDGSFRIMRSASTWDMNK